MRGGGGRRTRGSRSRSSTSRTVRGHWGYHRYDHLFPLFLGDPFFLLVLGRHGGREHHHQARRRRWRYHRRRVRPLPLRRPLLAFRRGPQHDLRRDGAPAGAVTRNAAYQDENNPEGLIRVSGCDMISTGPAALACVALSATPFRFE